MTAPPASVRPVDGDGGARGAVAFIDRLALPALLALVAVPWLLLAYPPFQDLPGHAAMLAIRERLGGSPFLQRYFQPTSTLGPYGVFLGLGHAFYPLLGAEGAVRLVGAISNCALPLVVVLARRWVHPQPWRGAGFLALCLSLGFMTAQGFVSFLIGLSAFALAFCRWVSLLCPSPQTPPSPRLQLQVAALALGTFFAHGFAFLLLLLCAGVTTLLAGSLRRTLWRAWVFLPAVLVMVAIYLRDRGLYPPDPSGPLLDFRSPQAKLQMLFLPTTFSRLGTDVVVAGVVWILLGAAVVTLLRRGRRPTLSLDARPARESSGRAPRLMAGTALVLFALAIVAPKRFDFFGSLDIRLACAAILVAILGVDPSALGPRLQRALRLAPLGLAAAMVATLLVAAAGFQAEARPADQLLQQIPDHRRVLYLPMSPYSRTWAAMPFFHFEKRLLFTRDVLVGNVWLHQGTALRPTSLGLPLLTVTPVATSDGEVPWAKYDVRPWDFVLIGNGRARLPGGVPAGLTLVSSSGGMHLYRNLRPAGP